MLTQEQVKFLCYVSDLELKKHNNIPYGVYKKETTYKDVLVPYNEFKKLMGLEDPRLHWLLSYNGFMAGGAVLAWLLQDDSGNDIDFFFRNKDAANSFSLFIGQYDFVETNDTTYAKTYFNYEESVILQVVGGGEAENKKLHDGTAVSLFGSPMEIINNFDISVCKFAVDCDNFYSNRNAIADLITRTLHLNIEKNTSGFFNTVKSMFGSKGNMTLPYVERVLKYHRKGFYIPKPQGLQYDPNTDSW